MKISKIKIYQGETLIDCCKAMENDGLSFFFEDSLSLNHGSIMFNYYSFEIKEIIFFFCILSPELFTESLWVTDFTGPSIQSKLMLFVGKRLYCNKNLPYLNFYN